MCLGELLVIPVCYLSSLQVLKELAEWDGQCPPTAKHQRGKIITPKLKEVIGKVGQMTPRATTHVEHQVYLPVYH